MKRFVILVLTVSFCVGLAFTTQLTPALAFDTTVEDWGIDTFNKLDYGIYWYNGISRTPTADYEIDKTKPTLIYTHGWKPSNEWNVREDMSIKNKTVTRLKDDFGETYKFNEYFYDYYIQQGYNVGVFYWNQLSGTQQLTTDAKIWSVDDKDSMGMNYYYYGANGETLLTKEDDPTNPKKSVCNLYADAIVDALGSDFSGKLHLAGHSMGGQLTAAVSENLCLRYDRKEIGANLLPERVTMLDPYISFTKINGYIDYKNEYGKGRCVGTLVGLATETINKHNIPIEMYGVNAGMCFQNYLISAIGNSEKVKEYKKEVAFVAENIKKYVATVYLAGMHETYNLFDPSHVMSVDYYFTTNNYDVAYTSDGIVVPSAKITTEQLRSLVGMTFAQKCAKGTSECLYSGECTFDRIGYDGIAKNALTPVVANRLVGEVDIKKTDRVKVKLCDETGEVVNETALDNLKRYVFEDVAEGNYTVKVYVGEEEREVREVTVKGGNTVAEKVEIPVDYKKDVVYAVCIALGAAIIAITLIILLSVRGYKIRKKKSA